MSQSSEMVERLKSSFLNDIEVVVSVLEAYLQSVDLQIQAFDIALEKKVAREARERAHALKSSIGILQADGVYQQIRDLEQLCKEEKLQEAEKLMHELRPYLSELNQTVREIVETFHTSHNSNNNLSTERKEVSGL